MKRYLGVRNKIPTQPIVIDEPVGLVEVKPEPGLEMFVFRGDEMLENKSCQICLQGISDGMEAVRAACKHIFHGICVSQWLSKEDSCPVCRFLLLKLAQFSFEDQGFDLVGVVLCVFRRVVCSRYTVRLVRALMPIELIKLNFDLFLDSLMMFYSHHSHITTLQNLSHLIYVFGCYSEIFEIRIYFEIN